MGALSGSTVTSVSTSFRLNSKPARATPAQPFSLALTLSFNQKLISDDDTNSALSIVSPDKLPKAVRKSLQNVLNRLSGKLAAAYPSCFNPRWNQVSPSAEPHRTSAHHLIEGVMLTRHGLCRGWSATRTCTARWLTRSSASSSRATTQKRASSSTRSRRSVSSQQTQQC